MLDPLPLSVISERASYCVMRDTARRESIVVRGSAIIQWKNSRDFQVFKSPGLVPRSYAPIQVDADKFIGVWCDPTKPELAWIQPDTEHVVVETVPAPVETVVEDAENIPGLAVAAAGDAVREAVK